MCGALTFLCVTCGRDSTDRRMIAGEGATSTGGVAARGVPREWTIASSQPCLLAKISTVLDPAVISWPANHDHQCREERHARLQAS